MSAGLLARHIVPNLFDPTHYYKLNVRTGVMHNAFGTKCCTFSGYALQGLYKSLREETGPAWHLVIRRCGEFWGARFAKRFLEEISSFYNEDLEHMTMARFTALLEEYLAVSGWGRARFDFSKIEHGLLLVDVQNEVLGDILRNTGERAGALLEGVLKTTFSEVTGQEMDCYETRSIGAGASTSQFVIGTRARLKPVLAWIEAEASHEDILTRLITE